MKALFCGRPSYQKRREITERITNQHTTLRNLRIADLELFVTAARLNNLGQAASIHYLSQSAASTAIQRLEAALGFALCMHEKRKFRLTQEGTYFLPRAEMWLKTLCEAVDSKKSIPIRLATTHAIARIAVPSILPIESIELTLMRPDAAYGAILRNEKDVALVLDNAPWEGVSVTEVGHGCFQLYSSKKKAQRQSVLLPEDQMEALTLQQRWLQAYHQTLPVKARIPSWSLIADICSRSGEIGFLPDFLAKGSNLHPISWQPTPCKYRVLALYKDTGKVFQKRLETLLEAWKIMFHGS